MLHVPVRCLITAKVSTHPLCWRPVCLCVCLPACLSLTMRPLGSNLLTSPLKIASSAGILVQFTTPPGAQTDTLIPQAERSFHRRANISSVSGSGLSPSSPISSTCFTPLLVFNAVDTEQGDAVELTAAWKIDLSCETCSQTHQRLWKRHSRWRLERKNLLFIWGVMGFMGPESEAFQLPFGDFGTTCLLL